MKIDLLIEKIERNHHIIMLVILLLMLLSPLAYSQTPCITDLSETHNNVSCFGNANGVINISTSVPNGNLNYLWSDGNTDEDRTNLIPGTYTVTATDGEYCNETLSITITEPSELTAIETHQASTCGGILNNVIVLPNGGTAPYAYLWNDGNTNDERTQLSGGNHTVTVTDASGCTKQLILSNNSTNPFHVTVIRQTKISCYGMCDGSLKIDAIASSPPFSYLWSAGATTNTISGICHGYYTVTVTNGFGCSVVKTHFLCGPNKLAAPFTKTEITAPAANDGSVTWLTKGGTKPYSYLWSDGYLSANRTSISPGKYTITVTDANGCTTFKKITWKDPIVQRNSNSIEESELNISPNPSIDKFEIEMEVNENSDYTVAVINADGRLIIKQNYILNEGIQQLTIDLSKKPKGIYTLLISNKERRFIKKLVLL